MFGEQLLLAAHDVHKHRASGHLQRGLNGVCHAGGLGALARHQAVNYDLDVVPLLLVQVGGLGNLVGLAVHPDAHETGHAGLLEHGLVLALLSANHRGHDLDSAVVGQGQHGIDDLLDGLALPGPAAFVAVRTAHPRVQEPQVVVNLGDGPDGRAGIVGDALLVDGDGGRQPLDVINIGLVHSPQELPSVGRQGFDVTPLSLGVDGIEGQGAFAGA